MLLKRLFNLKNICRNVIKNIVLIIIIFTISGSCLIGCSKNANTNTNTQKPMEEIKKAQEVSNKTRNEVIEEIKKLQINCFTEIVYASKNKVVLYGPIGLIVYDMINKQIYRAIDLKSINMNYVQGDIVTIFKIKKDESQLLMYNDGFKDDLKNDDRYIYDIENDTLQKTDIKNFENEYNTTNSFTDECFEKYKNSDIEIGSTCFIMDEIYRCYLIYPRKNENEDYRGISDLQIVIFNKDTNKEDRYTVFN
jgi:hypothetical protein